MGEHEGQPKPDSTGPERAGEPKVNATEFVRFLEGQLDQHGQRPPYPTGLDRNVNTEVFRTAKIPGRPGEPGITVTERADDEHILVYDVIDAAGNKYEVTQASPTGKRTAHGGEVSDVSDFADLQDAITELQRAQASGFADKVEQYGGTPEFVQKLRNQNGDPKPGHRKPGRGRRWVTGVLTAAALLSGAFGIGKLAGGGGSEAPAPPQPPGAGAPEVPGPEQPGEKAKDPAFEQKEKETRAALENTAKDAARSVLDDLDNPKAGTENYAGTRVGNKAAVVGPDAESGTKDDSQYAGVPEMFAFFDPDNNTVYIRSVSGHGTGDDATFTSVESLFQVEDDSAIATNPNQLTTKDFREALADADTHLKAIALTNNNDFDETTQNSPVGESYGVYLAEDGSIIVGHETGADTLMMDAKAGREPLVPLHPTGLGDNVEKVESLDGLNVAKFHLGEIADAATAQLSNDTNGGNRGGDN